MEFLFYDGFCYLLGLLYLWIKNKGKKSFNEIKKQTDDIGHIGNMLIINSFILIMIILVFIFLLVLIYNAIRGISFER